MILAKITADGLFRVLITKLWKAFNFIDQSWKSIGNVSLTSVFREANSMADGLAKAGVEHSCLFSAWWW